jgi:tRNA G18 (ribose-2'-O)-methylase SpoU
MKDVVLILDNIRSVHNVGSIFRTAETAGVVKAVQSIRSPLGPSWGP